jgi:nucleotide-binding universal stress UspA family protein
VRLPSKDDSGIPQTELSLRAWGLLRWALARVVIRDEERIRLENASAEEKELLPKIERILVGLDGSNDSAFAARLAGWLVGARHISATTIDLTKRAHDAEKALPLSDGVIEAAKTATETISLRKEELATQQVDKKPADHPLDGIKTTTIAEKGPIENLISVLKPKHDANTGDELAEAVLAEEKNGYGLILVGTGDSLKSSPFVLSLGKIVRGASVPVAALFAASDYAKQSASLTRILVPTTGADYSRFGAEIAVAIAKGCGASITALHVSVSKDLSLRNAEISLRSGRALVAEIEALGKRAGVKVQTKALRGRAKDSAILREAAGHQLIVIGTKSQSTDQLHFGTSAMAVIEQAQCPVLIVKS